MTPFASWEDYEVCRRLHRAYGTTYYFASRRFPPQVRADVDALYGFVRVPDEWVDNPAGEPTPQIEARLGCFREEFVRGLRGARPASPVLRAFVDTMRRHDMSPDEPLLFLDAMQMDLTVTRYATYQDLREYMRGSAAAVGLMMCKILGVDETQPSLCNGAIALGEAMQLTNFLRDVREDYERGRVYLPQEDLDRFGVSESQIGRARVTPAFEELMKFEIARARGLYGQADEAISELPTGLALPVRLARVLYARILDRIERQEYDVFSRRARTTKPEKMWVAARLILKSGLR